MALSFVLLAMCSSRPASWFAVTPPPCLVLVYVIVSTWSSCALLLILCPFPHVSAGFQEQRRSDDTDKDKDISRQEVGQAVESNPTLTVDGLILFIAYVINCTDQVRHKTEKINNVKGAEKFLGINNISWENTNKRLEVDGKSGGDGDKTTWILYNGMQEAC